MHRFNKPASLSSLTAALLSAFVLSACGGGGGGAGEAPAGTGEAGDGRKTPVAASPKPDSGNKNMTPYGQDGGQYTLTFSEEFNGSSLNGSVWTDTIWYEQSNPTKNYAVEDGKLKIWPQRDASGKFFNRTIDTDGKYYQTYGYFEMEAKLPYGKGVWPAFWLFNHIGNRRPEIDIMEAYPGGGPSNGWGTADLRPNVYAATIWTDYKVEHGHKKVNTPDLSAGFHKYAVKWEPGKQTFYFDGKEVWTTNVTMGDPMYIMLDLWFGSASGTPDSTTPTGKTNSFEVNYVRAWQFK
jgi:beta-glucanase (GH16 family)